MGEFDFEDCPDKGNLFLIKSLAACIADGTVVEGGLVNMGAGACCVVVAVVVTKGLERSCMTLEGGTKFWRDILTWGRFGKFWMI